MTLQQQGGITSPTGNPAEPPSELTPELLALLADQQLKTRLASWVDTQFKVMETARNQYDRQWHINLAFYNGRQNISPVTVAGSGFRLTVPKAPPWRVRLVINKIRTAVRTECSKLTSSKPVPVVIPATTEDEDLASSRVAETVLNSEFSNDEHAARIREWVWWGVVTGNSYLKSWWDPNQEDDRCFTEPEIPPILMANPQLLKAWSESPAAMPQPAKGKICQEVVNPFHLYVPDLLSTSIEKQPYVMHVSTKTPDFLQQQFGFRPTPDARTAHTLEESAVLTPVGATNQHFDACLVKEVWIKPGGHPQFPQGGLITVVASQVVQLVTEWPVPFKEFPFYPYEGIPTGSFYKESVVTDLIPVQKEYNRTRSQIVEIKNLMGKPKIMGYKGSFNPRMVNSEPGQAIMVTPGYDLPMVLPGAEVPSTMPMEIDRLTAEFDDISGQHEITRGSTPSQVTSGTAISFLQEQDESKLYYQVAGIENATAKYGKHYLCYAVKYWQDGRIVKIVGRDGDFESRHWMSNAQKGNTDVIVQAGSGLPVSKAAKQALITDLMQNGFIDPMAGLEVMDLQSLNKILEDFMIDKRQAQRENLKMAELDPQEVSSLVNPPVGEDGEPEYATPKQAPDQVDPETGAKIQQPPPKPVIIDEHGAPWQPQAPIPVNSWDAHEVHIKYHNQFRKTQQFELLDENIKKAFELHVQTHQMAMSYPQMGQVGMVANQDKAGLDPNAPTADPNAQAAPPDAQEPTQDESQQPVPQGPPA